MSDLLNTLYIYMCECKKYINAVKGPFQQNSNFHTSIEYSIVINGDNFICSLSVCLMLHSYENKIMLLNLLVLNRYTQFSEYFSA